MSVISLQARLSPHFDSLKQTQQLISRLSKLPSNPGSSSSNPDEADARVELSNEIHQTLKEQEEDFELIRQEAEDITNGSNSARRRDTSRENERQRERIDLKSQVDKFDADLKIARAQFRKAQLQAKRNAEAAQRKERELLFASIQEGSSNPATSGGSGRQRGQEPKSQDEVVLGASDDVTAALRRTYNLMSGELERSQFAHETLENSTKELASLTENYSNLDTLLSSSKNLVGTLIRSQKSDTWYLETAFYVLAITIGWLVFRRIIYGPGWWLVYFPLRTLWWAIQVPLGFLASISGLAGAEGKSKALSEASNSLGTSILGTGGRAGIPTFPPGMAAPSVRVGAGGYGAKAGDAQQQQPSGSDGGKSLSDQVGELAERSRQADDTQEEPEPESQGTVLKERTAEDGLPNPKKRMWEEPVGDVAQKFRPRDEL